MADLRPVRALSIEKVRNLWRNAQVALNDARAPAQYVSAPRRFDAAYDCGLACALLVLECKKLEISGLGHHKAALEYLVKELGLKGQVAQAVPVMVQARNASRYDAAPIITEAIVAEAVSWAERLRDETEGWLQVHQPLALK